MFAFLQKRARMVLFLLAASLILSLPVFAFQNEPDGFRGIKWGTNISELSEMGIIEDHGEQKLYVRKNDKMQIGDADLEVIIYVFYKDRLYGVMVIYNSSLNFSKLKETLFQVYGSGRRPNPFMEKYNWYGSSVLITLDFNEIREKGSIIYFYVPILKEQERDVKEKAKKGASDL